MHNSVVLLMKSKTYKTYRIIIKMKTGENSLKGTPSIMRFTRTHSQVRYIYVSLPTGCKPCSEAGGGVWIAALFLGFNLRRE